MPEQVARIVGNLIENALRHTPPGGLIEVSMTTERGAVLIEVADTGTGIAPEALGRIFDRFWRGAGPHAEGGAGLGLAIARGLARAHGGDVRVRSGLGTGSTFTIRLPLRLRRISGPSTVS